MSGEGTPRANEMTPSGGTMLTTRVAIHAIARHGKRTPANRDRPACEPGAGSSTTERRDHAMSMTDTIRQGYADFSERDYAFMERTFDEDISWSSPGAPPLQGREAVRAFFDGLREQFASHTITLDDAVETPDRLICRCHHEFTREGHDPVRVDSIMDWRHRDGRMVELYEMADTLAFAVAAGMLPAEALPQRA
jgi:ketosteroid isomerase-like protein